METIEKNKMIAEFMGAFPSTRFTDGNTYEYPPDLAPTKNSSFHWDLKSMEYAERWDWLMPVVERIHPLVFSFDIGKNGAILFRHGEGVILPFFKCSKDEKPVIIDCAYDVVIQFIQWYNTTKH